MKNASFPMASVLFIVFLILKLNKVIDWSWWWITAPLWGSVILFFFIAIVSLLIFIVKNPGKAEKAGLIRKVN